MDAEAEGGLVVDIEGVLNSPLLVSLKEDSADITDAINAVDDIIGQFFVPFDKSLFDIDAIGLSGTFLEDTGDFKAYVIFRFTSDMDVAGLN